MAQNAGGWQNSTSNTCLPYQKVFQKYIEDTLATKLKQRTAQNKPTNAFISDNIFGREVDVNIYVHVYKPLEMCFMTWDKLHIKVTPIFKT